MQDNNLNFETLLLNVINKCDGKFVEAIAKDFQLLYPFTTENIAGYINYFNLCKGKLLTVGSSGDQIINARLFDCMDIVCVDLCPYTRFYIYLKLSCLLELEKKDFLNFLCYKNYPKLFKYNKRAFDNNIYKKIKATLRLLDYESYLIWDELFSTFNGLDIRKNLFYFDENELKVIIKCNPYLQSDIAYEEVREKITKMNLEIITGDISKINIDQKFSSIWLSNIAVYHSKEFLKILIDKLLNNLDDNGKLLICYLYKTVYHQSFNPRYNLDETLDFLKDYSPEPISFASVDGRKNNDNIIKKDSILVYSKK